MVGAYPGNAAGEQWLYRQGELVLGPVSREQLVDRLYSGEINAQTEVARMGESAFRRLHTVDGFGLHVAKAQAKLRVEAKERHDQQASRRKKTILLSGVIAAAILIAVGAAVGARYLAINTPWSHADAFADISMDPPTITLAKARAADEELLDYPLEPGKPGHRGERTERAERGSDRTRGERGNRGTSSAPRPTTDSEGLQVAEVDQASIHEVVAAHQKSLYPCLVAEAKRKPGLSARIPIEFAIGNDGRVAKLWIDNPDYKAGPLADCMLKELQRWPFKPYEGAGASVGLSFTIGKKGG